MQKLTIHIGTGMVLGVEAVPIVVEASARDAGDGTPRILGLVDAAVREAYHRVLQAFVALGLPSPRGVTTVNFAPAALKKHGAGFDLPLALALAGAGGLFASERTDGLWAFGEVSLQGRLLPARGTFSVALAARARGAHTLLTSAADAPACADVDGLAVRGAATLADALLWVAGQRELPPAAAGGNGWPGSGTAAALAGAGTTTAHGGEPPDLADLRGQENAKHALCVAAAGGHNVLFVGPPGCGKSALCRRLPGLLPPPTTEERQEIVQVHTAAGLPPLPPHARPLRAPHHTSSWTSLLGGGPEVRPGEVTLAHRGVLFLDELPEFRRDALEALRQPLEDGVVTVGRAQRTATMPARFLLVAAMNPCPCGFLGHPARPCTCPPPVLARYRSRLSGPLLDRIDLQVEVPALDPAEFRRKPDPAFTTAAWRERIAAARQRQLARNRDGSRRLPNAELQDRLLERACAADARTLDLLESVLVAHRLGGRSRVRLLRVARTLADLDDRERLLPEDVLAAAALRGYARQHAG